MADLIKKITEKAEFDDLISTKKCLIVVDFHATWCGPCKMIAPKLEEIAKEYSDILVVKVDVDEAEDIAEEAGVSAMPTFHFYKNGSKVDELTGANEAMLRELVKKNK